MKTLSLFLCIVMLSSVLFACAPVVRDSAASSDGDLSKYEDFLTSRLEDMPDSLVIALVDKAEKYGVDMSEFADDGYLTRAEAGDVVILGKSEAGIDRAVRDYAKNGNEDDYFAVYGEGYRVKRLTVAGNDISEYAIVTEDSADECQLFAAEELASHIEQSCGASLEIFSESAYASASEKAPRKISFTSGNEALGDEGFTITVGEDGGLSIEGGIWRGCLFGVYGLLEDIGWRFVYDGREARSSDQSKAALIPDYLYESEHVDLTADINRTEVPAIPIRGGMGEQKARSTYTGHSATYGVAKYGGMGYAWIANHGLQGAYSSIFSGEFEGLFDWRSQPCFTNEDVIEAIEIYAHKYARARLDAGQVIGRELLSVDIAQFDGMNFCSCKTCDKVENEEKAKAGAVVRMANRVAEGLDKEFPGLSVTILAYAGSDIAPKKTVPAHNVYVGYCFYIGAGYNTCSNHCISGEDCDPASFNSNVIPGQRFEDWLDIMDPSMLQVWYYDLNVVGTAYNAPVYTCHFEDMKYLISSGVEHVYVCCGFSLGAGNETLSRYLMSKVAWDGDLTYEEYLAHMREWCLIAYGDSGDYVYECMLIAERAGDRAGCWNSFNRWVDHADYGYMALHDDQVWNAYLSAVANADTTDQQELCEIYFAGLMFMCLCGTYEDEYVNGSDEERAEVAKMYTEMHRLFRLHSIAVKSDLGSPKNGELLPEVLDLNVNPHYYYETHQ